MKGLTVRQAEVLTTLQTMFAELDGTPPSRSQLAARLKTSTSAVLTVLGALANKNYIQLEGGLRLLRPAPPVLTHRPYTLADAAEQTQVLT